MVNSSDQRGLQPDEPIDPSVPHDMENITVPIHIGFTRCCRSGTSGHSEASAASAGLICFTQAKCELPLLMHCQYKHTRDVWGESCGHYMGGRKYPFLPCLQPLICLYLSKAITLTQTQQVLLNMLNQEVGFYFHYNSKDGRTADNCMLMKALWNMSVAAE